MDFPGVVMYLVALPVSDHKCFVKHFLKEIKPPSNGFPITEIIYLNGL